MSSHRTLPGLFVRDLKKNTPLASGARPDAAQAKVGVSYAAALANNAHDHSVNGNFTWWF